MTHYTIIPPASIDTTLRLPASKSISNRVLIIHALAGGGPLPENLSDCDDTRVMMDALARQLPTVDIKAAGTAMRFLTAYLSTVPGERVLTGTARMQQRPIHILVDALRTLGARIGYEGNEGFPPLRIVGGSLTGGAIALQGNVSSQFISALLLIAPTLPQGLTLRLEGEIVSRPYIDLTLQLMNQFGAQAGWDGADCLRVSPRPYQSRPFEVESDWSAASYWYEITALAPQAEVRLPGLHARSLQGDSRGAGLFARLGVETSFDSQGAVLRKTACQAARMEADLVEMPDLAQTFVVTCALLGVPFRFTGLQSLKIKETDRIAALKAELRKLGCSVEERNGDTLLWNGERCPAEAAPVIRTYEDHRMAMAFAPAAFRHPGLRIACPEVVTKSYPGYWHDLRQAGFAIDTHEEQPPASCEPPATPRRRVAGGL